MSDKKGQLTVTYREDEGEVDRRRFAGVMGVGFTLMVLLAVVSLSLGMIGAAVGVGLGGFVANFDTVEAEGQASIYPVLGEQAACDEAPQVEAALDGEVEVFAADNTTPAVEFFKDLPLPAAFNANDFARITITATGDQNAPIEANNLDLRFSALEAGTLALGDQAGIAAETFDAADIDDRANIAEFNPDGTSAEDSYANDDALNTTSPINASDEIGTDVGDGETTFQDNTEFGISAQGFVVNEGTAAAHQVTLDGINLQNLNFAVQILNETTDSAVVNPATPTDAECSTLSDYAELDDQPYMGDEVDMTNASQGGIQLDDETSATEDDGDSPRSDENP